MGEGYLDIAEPTGRFGPLTQQALKAYQMAHNIVPATGYFGPTTRLSVAGDKTTETKSTARSDSDISLATVIDLFISLGIIPKEKEGVARDALRSLESV